MKKGRHRRYEEARNLKRGGDLDIEAIFSDLEGDRPAPVVQDVEDGDDAVDEPYEADELSDDDEFDRG